MLRKLSVVMMLALAACGSARLVSQDPSGTTFALEGDRNKAMDDANAQMTAQCGPGAYHMVSQGEFVIGEDSFAQSDTQYGEKTSRNGRRTQGGSNTQAQSSTRQATEWRITFACNNAPAPAGPPAGGPGGPPFGGPGGPPPPPPGY
jgi:hypothetical protein